jgi:hypothetical protein
MPPIEDRRTEASQFSRNERAMLREGTVSMRIEYPYNNEKPFGRSEYGERRHHGSRVIAVCQTGTYGFLPGGFVAAPVPPGVASYFGNGFG